MGSHGRYDADFDVRLNDTVVFVGDEPVGVEPRYQASMDTNKFLWLLTGGEIRAIEQSAAVDDDVYRMWHVVQNTPSGINLDDPDMVAGLGLLVSKGLLTTGRRDEILQGYPL